MRFIIRCAPLLPEGGMDPIRKHWRWWATVQTDNPIQSLLCHMRTARHLGEGWVLVIDSFAAWEIEMEERGRVARRKHLQRQDA